MMASAGIRVIYIQVPNLGARWSRFLAVTLMMAECWYMGHTYRGPKSGCKIVTLFGGYSYDGVSAGVWVIHTEVPNLGVTLFGNCCDDGVIAGIWVIHTGAKSGGEVVTLFDSYSYDGVSAGI